MYYNNIDYLSILNTNIEPKYSKKIDFKNTFTKDVSNEIKVATP